MFPGPIRQIGFIVADLDAAIGQWVGLGVAPWLPVRDLHMEGCSYRGSPSSPVISLALANSGDLQVELIQQHDDTPSIYREFVERHGSGFHQVAYWPEDLVPVRDAAVAAGWTEVWSGDMGGTAFSYVEHPDSPATVVELMELTEATRAMGDHVRAAAAAWRPGDPTLLG